LYPFDDSNANGFSHCGFVSDGHNYDRYSWKVVLSMNSSPIHQTQLHKGFFAAYAIMNILVILGVAALTYAPTAGIGFILPGAPPVINTWAYFKIMLLPVGVILSIGWVQVLIAYKKSLIIFTPASVRFSTGLFFRTEGDLPWNEVETILMKQGPLGSILGYGTLVLIGNGGTPFHLPFLPEFQRLRELALSLRLKGKDVAVSSGTQASEEPSLRSGETCSVCGFAVSPEEVRLSKRSWDSFANQILCKKCSSYLPGR
jgi:membrane protein YdbS with pleckstrin-like domain